jgi:predicted TIM-barrel fold metal-dependent hydrolase
METIRNIEDISADYPNIPFILGHFGAIPSNMEYAAKVVKSRNNVYGDTTVSIMYEKNIEWLVEIAGEDRILFGTDAPFYDPRPNIGRILAADVPESAKEKILGRTMESLLRNIK